MFNVEVLSVKTINLAGKRKQQRKQATRYYRTPPLKKATVQVKKGQKIAVFEQASEPETEAATAEQAPVKEKKSLLRGTKVKIESTRLPAGQGVKNQESNKEEKEGDETKDRGGRSGNVTGLTKNGLAGSSK